LSSSFYSSTTNEKRSIGNIFPKSDDLRLLTCLKLSLLDEEVSYISHLLILFVKSALISVSLVDIISSKIFILFTFLFIEKLFLDERGF